MPWPKAPSSADRRAASLCPAYGQRDALVFDVPDSPSRPPHSLMMLSTAATDVVPASASIGASGTAPLAHLKTYQGE
jgi:hypothetical protein